MVDPFAAGPTPGFPSEHFAGTLPVALNPGETTPGASAAQDFATANLNPEPRDAASGLHPQPADDNDGEPSVASARRGEDVEFDASTPEDVTLDATADAGEVTSPSLDEGGASLEITPVGRRKVKPETLAFRAAFRDAAVAAAQVGVEEDLAEGEQRTQQWMTLREKRLTASAFGNALG